MAGLVKYRPSAADRWVNCPASVDAEAQFPEGPESEAARWGTACHELAYFSGLAGDPCEFIGKPAENGVLFTDEMAKIVLQYQDEINSWPNVGGYLLERTVRSDEFPDWGGTADGVASAHSESGETLYVADLKTGWGVVEPFENWQLLCYACLITEQFKLSPSQIIFVIIQPRPAHHLGRVRRWEIDADQLAGYRREIVEAMQCKTKHFNSGPHCTYCAAVRSCEANRQAGFRSLDVSTIDGLRKLEAHELSGEYKLLMAAQKRIETRLKGLKVEVEERAVGGEQIPGLYLIPAKGDTRWASGGAETIEALTGAKLRKEAFITPLQAKKAGVPAPLIDKFSETPSNGFKIVEGDVAEKAKEILNGK